MTRGLHPHTRPQRARSRGGDGWRVPSGGTMVEEQEPPPRRVAQILFGVTGLLLLIAMGGAALLLRTLQSRTPTAAAQARFESAAPPLLARPEIELAAERLAHPPPSEAQMDRAMGELLREGWGEEEAPPGRASTAMDRAEEMR